jgi:tRNA-2-methylthio-N6-dimethylallyladenosine synthase
MTEKVKIDWTAEEKVAEEVKEKLKERYGKRAPLAFVHSYGCQQNVADGEKIKGILSLCGCCFCDRVEDADIVIFNTCAVREHAEARVFGNVGALVHIKRKRPDMIIGLCGCMVQQDSVKERIKRSYPFVDIAFGPHMFPRLASILLEYIEKSKRVFDNREASGEITEGIKTIRDNKIRAFVSVMYGCDNFCSYCIVPYVRGRERSRKSEEILKECRSLVESGCKEIMLLGQNVNSYGKNLEEDINFSALLRKINEIPGDFRVRFMTSHPKDATKELIDTIRDSEKVCNQLHLPVQSGSDRILEEMNRRYKRENYLSLIEYAKKEIPDISFSSDIIVGFPNEQREDFDKTVSLVKEVGYDMLFTFIYSKRSGTRAAEMEDSISDKEKSARLRELIDLQASISEENNKKRIGKTVRVLFDSEGKTEGFISGRDEQNIIVEAKAPKELIGSFAEVEITEAQAFSVRGVLKG